MTTPVPGHRVTTPYGKPGSWAAGYHTGADYAAPQGTPVVAARTGRLIRTGWDGSYGNQVVLESDGIRHSYNHLSQIQPGLGGTIQAGQRVGLVGSTGNSTGPHLHYEERVAPYGYWQHRPPQFNQDTPTPTPTPTPDPEEDDVKPWAVQLGTKHGVVITDFATYRTGINTGLTLQELVNYGVITWYAGGREVQEEVRQQVLKLPQIG